MSVHVVDASPAAAREAFPATQYGFLLDPMRADATPVERFCLSLWASGLRLYPNLRAGAGVDIVNVAGIDLAPLWCALVAQRDAIYWYLWDSLSPLNCAKLAAYLRYSPDQIDAILRRGVIDRRGLRPSMWTSDRATTLVDAALEQAARYPEHFVELGMRRGPRTPYFALDEEVAYCLLEAGATFGEAVGVLQRRNAAHRMGCTDEELTEAVEAAVRLLCSPLTGDPYTVLFRRMVHR